MAPPPSGRSSATTAAPASLLAGRLRLTGWAAALIGLAVVEVLLFCLVITAWSLVTIWVGLPLFVSGALTVRGLADRRRLWSANTLGIPVERGYEPIPEAGLIARFRVVTRDRGTWRDLGWTLMDGTLGLTVHATVVALFAAGVLGLVLPLIWTTLPAGAALDFPFGMRVTDVHSALFIAVPNGLVYLVCWWLLTPPIMRWYGNLTRQVLRPSVAARLSQHIEHLATTRAASLDHQAIELQRIERDLHDGPQAHLVALGINLGLAEQLVGSDPRVTQQLLAEARQHNTNAIAELRTLVRGIRPPVLSDRGLVGAIETLAMKLPIDIEVDLSLPGRPPAAVESAVYFAVTEALTNAAKHSKAPMVWVRGQYTDGMLCMLVGDNGIGGATVREDGGLNGMRRRLDAFDGTVDVASPIGHGTMVTIQVPCELNAVQTEAGRAPDQLR